MKMKKLFAAKTSYKNKKKNKNLLTIIIPRHINRVNEINNELKKIKFKIIHHRSKAKKLKNTRYLYSRYLWRNKKIL